MTYWNCSGNNDLDRSSFANDNYFDQAQDLGRIPMRVITKARLREFWEADGRTDAEGPLRAWHTHVSNKMVTWHSWGDVKAGFGKASLIGNCVVFNIGGNKYRLVTRILYASQKVFILKIMTHREYDEDKWKEDCGCFSEPPAPRSAGKPPSHSNQGK